MMAQKQGPTICCAAAAALLYLLSLSQVNSAIHQHCMLPIKHLANTHSCCMTALRGLLQVPKTQGQANPIIDYITPIWPSISCASPARWG